MRHLNEFPLAKLGQIIFKTLVSTCRKTCTQSRLHNFSEYLNLMILPQRKHIVSYLANLT
jgi:hypothetical protein